MTDAGPRRSGRKKGPAKVLGKIYTDADSDANEAGGVEPTASMQNDGSDDDSEQQKQGRSKRRRQRCMVGQQSSYRAGLLSSAQQGEHPSAIEQHAEAQPSIEATEYQIVVSPPVQEGKGKSKQRGGLAKVIKAPTKRKKTKYDPAPMKAVAMRAQDFLEPVSQTNIPAAVDPCAALNCRPSAPSRCVPRPTTSRKRFHASQRSCSAGHVYSFYIACVRDHVSSRHVLQSEGVQGPGEESP